MTNVNLRFYQGYKVASKYGMVAYDGSLDYYAQKAVEEATETYEALIRDAEPVIRDILDQFPNIIRYLVELEDTLQKLLAVSTGIDNTGVR